MMDKQIKKATPYLYFVFRVLVGFFFMQHGVQKLFGAWGAQASQPLLSLMGFAGVVEFVGGLAILLGFFTRLAALVGGVQMVAAYFKAHASSALLPIMNRGELALMFFAAFLVLLAFGAKKWSLERLLFKRELF